MADLIEEIRISPHSNNHFKKDVEDMIKVIDRYREKKNMLPLNIKVSMSEIVPLKQNRSNITNQYGEPFYWGK